MERRRYSRVHAFHPVLYYSDIYPRPKVASTLDISLGGAKIETRYWLIESEGLEISIAIHPQVVRCRGRVMYALNHEGERQRVGIQFEDLSELDCLFLGQYVSAMTEPRA